MAIFSVTNILFDFFHFLTVSALSGFTQLNSMTFLKFLNEIRGIQDDFIKRH